MDFKKKYLDRYELEPIVTVLIYPDGKLEVEGVEGKTVRYRRQSIRSSSGK